MQYLVSVIDIRDSSPDPSDEAAVDAFNDRLKAQGHWVFAEGLEAPGSATVIDNRGDQRVVTDGPFLETKEFLGGLWIIEAPTREVAIDLAAEGSKVCNRKVEVRPFQMTEGDAQ